MSKSIKAVAANRKSGCNVAAETAGWAFFIHEWGTLNQEIRLTWTTAESACIELVASAPMKYNRWALLGFSLHQDRALIFHGKKVIADTKMQLGTLTAQGRPFTGAPFPRQTSANKRFYLGGFSPEKTGMHGFIGYMLDVRYYSAPFDSADTFFKAGVSRLEDLFSTGELQRNQVLAQIHFGTGSGPVRNRMTNELGDVTTLGQSPPTKPAGPMKAMVYNEAPDLSWTKLASQSAGAAFEGAGAGKYQGSDIEEVVDVYERGNYSPADHSYVRLYKREGLYGPQERVCMDPCPEESGRGVLLHSTGGCMSSSRTWE